MLNDAASLWKSAKQAVSGTVEKVQTNLSNALADLDGDNEGLENELQSYKEQLLEAQLQHVELSKQMRLMVAEKEAEIVVLQKVRNSDPGSEDQDQDQDMVIAAQIEIEKAKSESAAMGKNMLELSEKLRTALAENNEAKAIRSKMEGVQARHDEMAKDYTAIKKESKKQLVQKSETIDNLVAEYSNLASESELRAEQDEVRVSEVIRENEILATKLHVMELNIAELADRSAGSDGAGGAVNVSKVDADRIEELSKLRSRVLGLELDLKEARGAGKGGRGSGSSGGDAAAAAVAEAVETTSAAAAQVASRQIQAAVSTATVELRGQLEAAQQERRAFETQTQRLTTALEEAKAGTQGGPDSGGGAASATASAAASAALAERERRIAELEAAVTQSGQEKREFETRLREVSAEAEAIREKMVLLQRGDEQQRGALEAMKSNYAALEANKSADESDWRAQLTAAREDGERLQTDVSIKTKALEGYVAMMKAKDAEIEALTARLAALEQERDAAKTALCEAAAQAQAQSAEAEGARAAASKAREELGSVQASLSEAQAKAEALSSECAAAQQACEQARRDLADVESRYEAITEQRVAETRALCEEEAARQVADMAARRDKFVELYNKENLQRKRIHNRLLELQGNIRVVCRVRPVLELERKHTESGGATDVTEVPTRQDIIVTRDEASKTKFEYDHVFAPQASQEQLFDSVKPLCMSVLDGFNVCIFAYGQTGSGKTFTMEGEGEADGRGVAPRAISELFRIAGGEGAEEVDEEEGVMKPSAQEREQEGGGEGEGGSGAASASASASARAQHAWQYQFRFSMLEIYNEAVRDLLDGISTSNASSRAGSRTNSRSSSPTPGAGPSSSSSSSSVPPGAKSDGGNGKKDLDIRMTKDGGSVVVGLTEYAVTSAEEVVALMKQGQANRAVGSHDMNEHSSRSHSLLTLSVSGKNELSGSSTAGKLHLIDLAGSERVSKTDATGDRLKEAQNINRSLSALGDVIAALGTKSKGASGKGHVPYRNSKLTYLLQDSLGGNSKVCMIVNVSPVSRNVGETVCSLTFASRCRNVELGAAKRNAGK